MLLRSYDRVEQRYDAVVAIESLGHSSNLAATFRHWARQLRPGGVIVIIDDLFRPEVPLAHLETRRFMQSLHFPCLQSAPVEPCLHAGLSKAAWVVLSERYHVHTRPYEECDRLIHAYQLRGAHRGYIGGMLLEKFYSRAWGEYVLLVLIAAPSCQSLRHRQEAVETLRDQTFGA